MTDSPDLLALIAKAREPYLWAYSTVKELVAALEATATERDALSNHLARAQEVEARLLREREALVKERDAIAENNKTLGDQLDESAAMISRLVRERDAFTNKWAAALVERDNFQLERNALKTACAALLIEYVAARNEGSIEGFPPRAQAIVRRAEAALGVEGNRISELGPDDAEFGMSEHTKRTKRE
jgi:hypothetical protein